MGNLFTTVKLNMAAKPDKLITALLQKIETSFQRQMGLQN